MALLLLVDTQNNSENLQDRKGLAILTRGAQHALRSEVNIIFMPDVASLVSGLLAFETVPVQLVQWLLKRENT